MNNANKSQELVLMITKIVQSTVTKIIDERLAGMVKECVDRAVQESMDRAASEAAGSPAEESIDSAVERVEKTIESKIEDFENMSAYASFEEAYKDLFGDGTGDSKGCPEVVEYERGLNSADKTYSVQHSHLMHLLRQYGDEAYTDVVRKSRFYGSTLCGYVYSPYFFRRHIGRQFRDAVQSCIKYGEVQTPRMLFQGIVVGGAGRHVHHIVLKRILNELSVLAVLEKQNNYVFTERRQFTPLPVISALFSESLNGEQVSSYIEALEKLSRVRRIDFTINLDSAAFRVYSFLYCKAGYFYYKRDEIVAEDSGRGQLDECASGILSLSPVELFAEIKQSNVFSSRLNRSRGSFGNVGCLSSF